MVLFHVTWFIPELINRRRQSITIICWSFFIGSYPAVVTWESKILMVLFSARQAGTDRLSLLSYIRYTTQSKCMAWAFRLSLNWILVNHFDNPPVSDSLRSGLKFFLWFISPPGNDSFRENLCFSQDVFCQREISEMRGPTGVKFCTMVNTRPYFIMPL